MFMCIHAVSKLDRNQKFKSKVVFIVWFYTLTTTVRHLTKVFLSFTAFREQPCTVHDVHVHVQFQSSAFYTGLSYVNIYISIYKVVIFICPSVCLSDHNSGTP